MITMNNFKYGKIVGILKLKVTSSDLFVIDVHDL